MDICGQQESLTNSIFFRNASAVAGIIPSVFETLFYDPAVSESDSVAVYKELV